MLWSGNIAVSTRRSVKNASDLVEIWRNSSVDLSPDSPSLPYIQRIILNGIVKQQQQQKVLFNFAPSREASRFEGFQSFPAMMTAVLVVRLLLAC